MLRRAGATHTSPDRAVRDAAGATAWSSIRTHRPARVRLLTSRPVRRRARFRPRAVPDPRGHNQRPWLPRLAAPAAGPAYAESDWIVANELGQPPRPEWYSDRFQT